MLGPLDTPVTSIIAGSIFLIPTMCDLVTGFSHVNAPGPRSAYAAERLSPIGYVWNCG